MPGLNSPDTETAKIIYIGDSGHGKTGSFAALAALGYKIRMIDTDNGFKTIRSLLTDAAHYPYANYMKKHGIVPDISYIPIEVPVDIRVEARRGGESVNILGPTSAAGWNQAVNLLRDWNDGDRKLGSITDWANDTVLILDTMSTLAELAFYWVQEMNGRLGSLQDEHGRDTGGAQEMIRRVITKVTGNSVKCNVIMASHITWVDQSNHAAQSPEQRLRAGQSVDARGFPTVIGRALSPVAGKKWNDMFVVRRTGSGSNLQRRIYTQPFEGVDAKNSVYLEPSYDLSTGLGEIFCALQYKPPPTAFIAECGKSTTTATTPAATSGGFGGSGFGR